MRPPGRLLCGDALTWESEVLLTTASSSVLGGAGPRGRHGNQRTDHGLPAVLLPAMLHEGIAKVDRSRVARSTVGCDDTAVDPDKRLRGLCGSLGPPLQKKGKRTSGWRPKKTSSRARQCRSRCRPGRRFRRFRGRDRKTTTMRTERARWPLGDLARPLHPGGESQSKCC